MNGFYLRENLVANALNPKPSFETLIKFDFEFG